LFSTCYVYFLWFTKLTHQGDRSDCGVEEGNEETGICLRETDSEMLEWTVNAVFVEEMQ
jgi:hypothetical protein